MSRIDDRYYGERLDMDPDYSARAEARRRRGEDWYDRVDLSSARSDYGPRAYGGGLDERGLQRERQRHERGFFDRVADEISSWFGNEEAERRRRLDQLREERRGGNSGGEWPSEGKALGTYAGRGPRSYQRSDARIYEDVCERLLKHGDLDAGDIEVTVNNGEVTLIGTVESRRAKHLAEDLTESVSGVRGVNSRLRAVQYTI
jgi:osmotically-inducible protein OsmY